MSTLTGLTATDIGQLSAARIKALTPADIGGMTAAQLPGLTAAQMALFSTGQLFALTKAQVPYLSPSAVTGLAPKQVALLLPAQVGAFTADQIAALGTAQFAAINPGDILAMSPAQMKALTGAQVAGLTIPQFAVLSAGDIAAFTPDQVANINTTDIAILNPAQLKALTTAQLAALTKTQIAALTAGELKNLTPAQLGALGSNPLAPTIPTTPTPPAPTPTPPAPIPTPTPPAPTPAPPAPTPIPPAPTPTPPAPLPAPTPPAPTPAPTPTPPAPTPTPPAPTDTAPTTPTPQPPSTPLITPPATTPPAPEPQTLTSSQLGAMTGGQLAALTADQINALGSAQLAAITLDYSKMLALLQADAAGGMTAGEFGALQAWAAKFNVTGGITVSPYLQQIADNVILGNAANATWTGGSTVATPLGNLTAASTQTQVDELIGKWLLGTDTPGAKVKIDGAPNFTVTHKVDPAPLYAAGGPVMSDINQGNLGDCFFLAGLAEVAAQNPSAIQSMITDNGNGTYGVSFTVNGKLDFVTVDDELANGGTVFNHGADDWAGLVEKAYAQLQAGGNVTGNPSGFGNSYTNLANGGSPESALEAISGALTIIDYVADGASWKSYAFDGPSLTVPNNPKASKMTSSDTGISNADLMKELSADLAAGDYLVLSSTKDETGTDGKATLMSDHAMAIYGYDAGAGTFEIYNPWGTATSGAQPWDTVFEVGLDRLLSDGDIISVASSSPAGGMASPSPSLHPLGRAAQSPASLIGLAAVG